MGQNVRRQMRRAMGEEAVKQIEGQTTALGVHEQRLEWQTLEIERLNRLLNEVMLQKLALEQRLDSDNRRINELVLRVGDLESGINRDNEKVEGWFRDIWKRLRWQTSDR